MSTTVELERLRERVADRLHELAQAHYLATNNGAAIIPRMEIVDELTELEGQIRAGVL